jgi:ketosteroid isomerase-like protein
VDESTGVRVNEPFGDAVRWPIDADEVRQRVTDRFVQRLDLIRRRVAPRMLAQPAGSPLRRALVTRGSAASWAAFDNRDWDFMERAYAPDVIFTITGDELAFDLPPEAHGWQECRRVIEDLYEGFADLDQRLVEVIDLGGAHFINRIEGRLTGTYSGLDVERDFATLYELTGEGRVGRQWIADFAGLEAFLAERRAELGQAAHG